jgi:flavin reductase (DIM6/NTAB) family NADH-FMN oxidoreductase RutF
MQKEIHSNDILAMETRHRATFINSLGGFKSVVMIGTKSENGQENLAIFSSLFHLGANPALCGIIIRPDVSPRHTLNNILATKSYTINHLNESIYQQAHQTSARYEEQDSEFEKTGLTPKYVPTSFAPFVAESQIQFACELQQKIDLDINGTTLLIGKITYVNIPENCLSEDGFVNLEAAGTLTCSGLDAYHKTTKIARLSYAKPNKQPTEI